MLAPHVLWSPGRGLCLWAEDPDRPVTSTSRGRGRRHGARPHPFAADAAALADVLDVDGAPGQATLLLPSAPDSPRDSPSLTRGTPRAPESTGGTGGADGGDLAAWSVPVLEVGLDLLEREPWPGEDAAFAVLRALVAFGADLVGRGRVLPALEPPEAFTPDPDDPDGPDATTGTAGPWWRPVLQGADLVAADAFAAALPPSVRSEAGVGGTAARGAAEDPADPVDPVEVVTEALALAVDLHARRRLRPGPPVPGGPLAVLADPAHHRALGTGLARWEVVAAPHAGPARGTFRLTEIVVDDLGHALEESDPRFWLEFSLQAVQDPSLRVTAETVWRDAGTLRRWLDDPEELLLAELGRAARLYPELGDALRVPRPTGLELDGAGAHHFLLSVAADLTRAGFGVLLPTWWSRPGRLGLAASATGAEGPEGVVTTASRLGRDQLVDFSWRLAVDGEPLDDAEMATLVAAKAPLVRLRGQWVALDAERLRTGLEFLAARREGRATTVGDVLHLATAHPDDVGVPLPLESVDADGALGDLLAGTADRRLELLETPEGVDAVLRPYQRRGLSWLAFLAGLGLGGVLADDMGLGKTLQLLSLEAHERGGGTVGAAGHRATLLVCPTSVIGTWEREAARFTPALRVAAHHGPRRADAEGVAALAAEHDLVVTSYGTLTRDVGALAAVGFRRLVLDEAQMVKNSRSRAGRAVRRIEAGHRVALTGTPVENRLGELWSVLDAVNPGSLGSASAFRERYAVPVERHGRSDVADRLRRVTRPFLLRRLKTDPTVVDDLPDKIETIERCPLGPEQGSLYQVVVDEMMERLEDLPDGVERRGRVLAAMTKLKQVCDHPALLLQDGSPLGHRSGKVTRLEEILAEVLAAGEKALLFTQFTAFGDMLAPHLAARFDTEVAWLHGGTSRRARDAMVEAFQSGRPGSPSLFLLSLRAGGTGLTLTAAQHVVHLDRWWNPAVEDQATDRAFRIGQRRTVNVRKLVCGGTLEERIDELITSKRRLADTVVGTSEEDPDWLTGLSTADLRRVVALDPDALEDADDDPDDADGTGPDGTGPDGTGPDGTGEPGDGA